MIAFKENLPSHPRDEEIKDIAQLTEYEYERYLEILNGLDSVPEYLVDEVNAAKKEMPNLDEWEIIRWAVVNYIKKNRKEE